MAYSIPLRPVLRARPGLMPAQRSLVRVLAALGAFAFALLAVPGPACAAESAEGPGASTTVLMLDEGTDYYEPADEVRYWIDRSEATGAQAARDAVRRGDFHPVPRWPPTFGFSKGSYWFYLHLRNRDHPNADWRISIAYPLLDRIELFDAFGATNEPLQRTGDEVEFSERALADRNPSLQIELRPGQDREYLIRVSSTSSIQVPIAVATPRALLERAHEAQLALGIYYGIMVGLFFYNLVLYLSLRDRTFLYYLVYVLLFALGQFTLNGLAFEYFWPRSPDWANTAVLVFIGLGLISMLAFTRAFLDFPQQLPRVDRTVRAMIVGLAAIVLANPLLGYRYTIFVETGMVFVMVVTIFSAAIVVYRRGYRPARNYLIAWTALLLGVVAFASVSFGLLPKVFLTEYGIQIGSAAEMVLLSFALADRVHMLREENALLQRETAERLELRVQERTQALHAALDQLQQANRVLNDFSLRDGLTGAYNRRYLNRALEDTLARTRREGLPLSVLMVDLDRFKHVNDKHGHLSGDDCLVALAQCLMGLLHGEHERVARFGGEEFAVLLPGVALPAARARAELMRASIERLEVRSDDQRLSITASIGVAGSTGAENESGADVLRNADRALYEAKRRGRNRVVVVDPRASGFDGREQATVGD